MIAAMKPGSIIVDLAAENGGNCVATVPGQLVEYNGVKIIGSSNHTSLPSTPIDRLQATRIFPLDLQLSHRLCIPTT